MQAPTIEYAGGSHPGALERRNVEVPAHLLESVERRNLALRNRRVPANVPVVPELTAAEQDELRARTAAVLSL